jgi:lipoprotein-releasing system ATP-binding protein
MSDTQYNPPALAAPPLLAVRGLTKRLMHEGAEVHILKGIDLDIEQGEMVCIVGPSGAGKSTLLHILGTLDTPTAGTIEFQGEHVTRYSRRKLAEFRNRSLGFVFQFHHLLPEFTALENVMMPGLIRGKSRDSMMELGRSLLGEVGLQSRMSHRPSELSGGEQQRVAFARALILQPALVLADEPTGNLDSRTSESIHELVLQLNQRYRTTFLVVTHSRDLAATMPRVVHMRDGRVERDERKAPASGDRRATDEAAATLTLSNAPTIGNSPQT